jgi:hypothetical protein
LLFDPHEEMFSMFCLFQEGIISGNQEETRLLKRAREKSDDVSSNFTRTGTFQLGLSPLPKCLGLILVSPVKQCPAEPFFYVLLFPALSIIPIMWQVTKGGIFSSWSCAMRLISQTFMLVFMFMY